MTLMDLRRVWGPRPLIAAAVGVLIQDEHGRVLLQRRGDDGLWGEPGGALDPGEDFLTGARRELLEETGLTCQGLSLLPVPEGLQDGPELYHRYPNGHEIYITKDQAPGYGEHRVIGDKDFDAASGGGPGGTTETDRRTVRRSRTSSRRRRDRNRPAPRPRSAAPRQPGDCDLR